MWSSMPIGRRRKVLAAIGCAALATALVGVSAALAGASGARQLPAFCAAEYNSPFGGEIFWVTGPEGGGIGGPIMFPGVGRFAFGEGTAVITPSGRANIVCHGTASLGSPPTSIATGCAYLPNPRTTPAFPPIYSGRGQIVVTPSHKTTLTCHVDGLPT